MRVITFGELLLRLAAPGYTKLFQRDSFDVTFCGSEANVAVSLSVFGVDSVFVTKLPDSDVGYAAAHSLDYFKVDTSNIIYGDGRMGLYYLEKGASQRPSKVIYDRCYSSIALSKKEDFDWDVIFKGADWFHWTGINPALSDELSQICITACQKAKEHKVFISCDLNYRSKLWSPEKAISIMPGMMKCVDLCICNEEDAEKSLGLSNKQIDAVKGDLNKDSFFKISQEICRQYGCKYVATTLRKSHSASHNGWSAMLYVAKDNKAYFSREYEIQLVDRVGGGDSFSAGLIYALGKEMSYQASIEFATAASCLKQTIEGDYNRCSEKDVLALMRGKGNGRVVR